MTSTSLVRVTLKNYRCFSEIYPAVLQVGSGFTSLIGPNNAGKSSVLRFFYEVRHAIGHLGGLRDGNSTGGMLGNHPIALGGLRAPATDPMEIVYELAKGPLQFEIQVDAPSNVSVSYLKSALWTYHPQQLAWSIQLTSSSGEVLIQAGNGANVQSIHGTAIRLQNQNLVDASVMLDAVKALANSQYFGPYRNALNEGAAQYYDLNIGTQFIEQWHTWKTGGNKESIRAISRVTEDIRRLLGVKKLEINASNELKTLQILIDDRPHKLSELGAGIAQLIVVLGNALVQRPSYIVIDEPETHLHPALQLDFLTTLASYSSCGVVFATHSMGLARSVSDRIYSVQTGEKGSIIRPFEKTPHYAEFLGSMGIAGLQDIGWEKILLVEGPTDVRTFQQLLRKYNKDRGVVVLPLGGTSMITGKTAPQLEEIVRLCPNVFAIVDSELKSAAEKLAKDRIEFGKNCEALGIKCLTLEKRATENYLTERCVKAAFGKNFGALGDYGGTDAAGQFWGKTENWRGAHELTREELDATDLGKFLLAL